MAPRTIYLTSYDIYDEILRYDVPSGASAVISRREFEALGVPPRFGAFTREGTQMAGIFASPEGPVIFLDSQQVLAVSGHMEAFVGPALARSTQQFTLLRDGVVLFSVTYRPRHGIGANPYDQEAEDIDLFALIAAGVGHENFVRAYTKDW